MKKIRRDDILAERFNALSRAARPGGPLLKVQVWTVFAAIRYLLIAAKLPNSVFSRDLVRRAALAVWIGRN